MSNKPARTTETEPFLLLKNTKPGHPVSNEDLSEQIGAVSAHLCVVHREAALARSEATDAKYAANGAKTAADGAHDAITELRSLVLGDHAPRISRVEEKTEEVAHSTRRLSIPPGVKRGAVKGAGYAGLVSLVPIIQQLWPLIEKALSK